MQGKKKSGCRKAKGYQVDVGVWILFFLAVNAEVYNPLALVNICI